MIELIKTLCGLNGPSSNEEKVRDYIKKHIKPYADDVREDVMGNLIVFKKGKERRAKKLMVCAHMDEVGLIVTDITDDGYLKFDFVGGVDTRVVIGKRVLVGKKEIPGIIGFRAVHLTTPEERKHAPKTSELLIDIGCDKKTAAEKFVSRGDTVVFDSPFTQLSENRVKARALDDRFGCAVMMTLIEEELQYDTYFAFTVQEESGCRGATTAAFLVDPDYALVLESTTAGDIPSSEGSAKVCVLGGGAVIGCMDRSTVYDKNLFFKLRDIAERKRLPWQMKSRIAGGTDAGKVHVSKSGVRTTSLSLPTRYIHSPSCVGDVRDMTAVLQLAREFVNSGEEIFND